MHDIRFYGNNGEIKTIDEVVAAIGSFVRREPKRFYKVMVGSDSHPAESVALVTAVTVWRVGNGAIHFWTRAEPKHFATIRDRIWQEAIASITLAQEFRSRLGRELGDDFFWDGNEVHVDIGAGGPTREFIDGITGMIRGYDFKPIIKPYAFAASVVADRHT